MKYPNFKFFYVNDYTFVLTLLSGYYGTLNYSH